MALDGDRIVVDTPTTQPTEFDFLIAGANITFDVKLSPEFAELSDQIATWNKAFTPPLDEADPILPTPYPTAGF